WLHLQVQPKSVFEGDTLTLQCQGWKHIRVSQVKFYKDGKFLDFSKTSKTLSIEMATMKSSGQYKCTGEVMYITPGFTQTSATIMVQVQELFQTPVLSAVPSLEPHEGSMLNVTCKTKLHPQRSSLKLLFSFYKDGSTLQDRCYNPELYIPEVKEGDSGLYWCEVVPKGSRIQKQSSCLEIRVQTPVSRPLLTLQHRAAGPAVGDMVELLCESKSGSPPILYSFYLDGKMLRNDLAPHGRAISLLFRVKSEQDAGNYSCEARNNVSRERSEPKELSLNGSQVSSTFTSYNWLVAWLLGSLLGVMFIAAALLAYFRHWRKTEPLSAQNPPPAPGGEQCPLYDNAHHQQEKDEDVAYSVVYTISKRNKERPVEDFTSEGKDTSIVYTEVRCPQLSETSIKELK
uniref:Fc receptor-like protein 6 n=1 Tax=Castor canadensis TaxID=51338 RepID=A0A8B7WAP7_CASCN